MRTEFFDYLDASLRTPMKKSRDFLDFLIWGLSYAYFIVFIYYGISSMNVYALIASFLGGSVLPGALVFCIRTENTPNLISIMPLSRRKNILYKFFGALVYFLVIMFFVVALLFVMSLIIFGVTMIIEAASGNISGSEGEVIEEINEMPKMGVHGGIFAAVYFVFSYSAGMITGAIKNRKIRAVFLACVVAAVVIAMIVLKNPFLAESYDKISIPWLITALCIIAAIAALSAAVCLWIKKYKINY